MIRTVRFESSVQLPSDHSANDPAFFCACVCGRATAPPARLNTQSMVTEMIPFTKAMAGSRPQANGGAGQGQDGGTLAGALSFLRLFNRRCCWIDGGRQQETALAQPAGLAADDIVEDD